MRIAQLSDFHFTHITWNPFKLFSKRLLGNINWLISRKGVYKTTHLEPLPDLLKELQVDVALLGGDFTTTALKSEYERAKTFVDKIPCSWIAIPGNHDHYTYRSWRGKHFYRYFSNKRETISHPVDFFNLKDHGIEAHRMGSGWWLLALDTARATNLSSSRGIFSEKLESYIVEILSFIPPQDSVICFNHYPFFPQHEPHRNLDRGEALQSLLEKFPQIKLYLNGHTHRHAIADLQPNNLPILLDSGSCVQGFEATWNLIDLIDDHCIVTAYRWNERWEPFRKEKFEWNRGIQKG